MEIDLRCGDCRDFLKEYPSERVAIVTDSPYGIDWQPNERHRATHKREFAFGKIAGDSEPFDPAHLLRFEYVALFGANNFADRLPAHSGWLVWDKKNGTTADDSADCELIWTNRDCAVRMIRYLWRGIVKERQDRKYENGFRLHPHQKPVDVFKWIICQLKLEPGTLIIDPYMGSGSCGVAAIELGFSFVGFEIDENFFALAKERIAEAQAQLRLPFYESNL